MPQSDRMQPLQKTQTLWGAPLQLLPEYAISSWWPYVSLGLGSLQLFNSVTRAPLDFTLGAGVYEDNCR